MATVSHNIVKFSWTPRSIRFASCVCVCVFRLKLPGPTTQRERNRLSDAWCFFRKNATSTHHTLYIFYIEATDKYRTQTHTYLLIHIYIYIYIMQMVSQYSPNTQPTITHILSSIYIYIYIYMCCTSWFVNTHTPHPMQTKPPQLQQQLFAYVHPESSNIHESACSHVFGPNQLTIMQPLFNMHPNSTTLILAWHRNNLWNMIPTHLVIYITVQPTSRLIAYMAKYFNISQRQWTNTTTRDTYDMCHNPLWHRRAQPWFQHCLNICLSRWHRRVQPWFQYCL